jgi:hypothetical protein
MYAPHSSLHDTPAVSIIGSTLPFVRPTDRRDPTVAACRLVVGVTYVVCTCE